MVIRINGDNVTAALEYIKTSWNTYNPAYPFYYRFLDEAIDDLYRSEERVGRIFTAFAALGLFIACLGLFGLASFLTEQRTKEIGIRKVLGASTSGVCFLLSRNFVRWVLLANLIACPAAYLIMAGWLQNFANRVSISWWVFLSAAAVSLLIALLTVAYQTLKAAFSNPVKCLRYE
jgi:putative ABC transport system permease protein